MTSPVIFEFPLVIHRKYECRYCHSSENCKRYDPRTNEGHYIFCEACEQTWPDEADKSYERLERSRRSFLYDHKEVIKTALASFTTTNSFGKKKIDYKKFVPELIEFFQDNCEMLEDSEIQKLDLTFSISNEGVDLLDYFLNDYERPGLPK